MVNTMKSKRRNAGFSMAELLVVVAIILILTGVVVVAVFMYQRRLKHFESENAAKEIFVAAQNHLSAAETEGLLKSYRARADSDVETEEKKKKAVGTPVEGHAGEYLFSYPDEPTIADVMLPFGSIDDTVRVGGSYLIRYNLSTATVLEVFYSDRSSERYGVTLKTDYYSALENNYAGSQHFKNRRRAEAGDKSARVLGWYDGEGLAPREDYLAEPIIRVTNGNTLKVEISPLAALPGKTLKEKSALNLILTGVSSGKMMSFQLVKDKTPVTGVTTNADGWYVVTLDDVTRQGKNFASVCAGFKPGEDLLVRAVAFDNNVLSNIASSGVTKVNSLFGSLNSGVETNPVTGTDYVTVSSFRHLVNLDSGVSSLNWANLVNGEGQTGGISNASSMTVCQTSDLNWSTFLDDADTARVIYKGGTATADGCYLPILTSNPVYALKYFGQEHTVWNVKVDCTGNGGLFHTVSSDVSVCDLDLVNFNVTTDTGNAGALAGTIQGTVKQVRAFNAAPAQANPAASSDPVSIDFDESIYEIASGSGSAGGLAGSLDGGLVKNCAAAVYVSSGSGSAGGLLGDLSDDGSVSHSYAGGHTINTHYGVRTKVSDEPEIYEDVPKKTGAGRLNVQGKIAGGFIGTMNEGTVQDCYSTCSACCTNASGAVVGGFVGSAAGGSTDDKCYCTGLVAKESGSGLVWGSKVDENDNSRGAFAGKKTGGTLEGSYFIMSNYRATKEEDGKRAATTQEDLLPAIGSGSASGVSALDADAAAYKSFFNGAQKVEGRAYDTDLLLQAEKLHNVVQFGFKPIHYTEDGATVTLLHYGDWPVFETLTVNN